MAGPAIRCIELARQLQSEFEVCVFSPGGGATEYTQPPTDSFKIIAGAGKTQLYDLAKEFDILIVQANVLKNYPGLGRLEKFLIVDLYDPILFSLLVQFQDEPVTASSSYRLMHQVLERHMLAADFCLCASERQRDYYLGRFCALGRIDPDMYAFDPSLRKLIDVAPFGVSQVKAVKQSVGMRGLPGISESDFVLIWGGGVWDWFDPLTVIKAVEILSKKQNNIKLFFMGVHSPNPQVPRMSMAAKAEELARESGLLNKNVFFNESWVPYEKRADYLLEADVAVSAHYDLIETRFSFRTRILDYFWAGLPTITTTGDDLSNLIETSKAGITTGYENVDDWVKAISTLSENESLRKQYAENAANLRQKFYWSQSAEPIARFCRDPYKLPPHQRVTMPSILERAQAVYARGGTDLVINRSKELLKDLLR